MRVGQRFLFGGKEWEVAHVLDGKVYAHESSGQAAKTREFDPVKTPGEANELTGATRPKARKISGGKSGSDVTVVEPHNDPSTHDPNIPIPPDADLTPEQWQRFGRLEQLHFTDLQQRYGKHKPSGASQMIKQAYADYDTEIQDLVSNAYASQYGSSSGWTLSLTSVFKDFFGKSAALEKARDNRERAIELQSLIRDAYAWDLYNRTKSPDVVITHKDSSSSSYWKQFITGEKTVFSGLSWSHHYRRDFFGQQAGLMGAASIRHIVMATWVGGPLKGAKKSFAGEKEFSIPYQLKVDDRFITFHKTDVKHSHLDWMEAATETPAGGETFEMFRAALEGKGTLPTPPPKPNIAMEGKNYLPPPPTAAEAMAEYHAKLPEIGKGVNAEQLAKLDLPFDNLDEKGIPQALVASESGAQIGDFLMGKQGTLYWLGPDPGGDGNGRLHKLVPDGQGGLKFNDETFSYQDGYPNYKLKGSVAPQSLTDEEFDNNAWVMAVGEPVPIGAMQPGDKFKVDGTPYEVITKPGVATTSIKDLESGLAGTINSEYATLPLEPKEGYVAMGAVKPAKGMTLAYDGKKHTITSIKKDGTISVKPAGGKVVALDPDDPALADKFDPGAWVMGGLIKANSLSQGDVFHVGTGKAIRPYKVTSIEGKKVNWKNLDTGKTGTFLGHKKVKVLNPNEGGTGHADEPVVKEPTAQAPEPPTQAEGESGKLTAAELAPGPKNEDAYEAALDKLPDAAGAFSAYKSSHGPGGKYKHERIQDLPKGTVFQDKTGKKWMVQHQATTAIITDGEQSFQINGGLRGKVIGGAPGAEAAKQMQNVPDPVLVEKVTTVAVEPTPTPGSSAGLEPDVVAFLAGEEATPPQADLPEPEVPGPEPSADPSWEEIEASLVPNDSLEADDLTAGTYFKYGKGGSTWKYLGDNKIQAIYAPNGSTPVMTEPVIMSSVKPGLLVPSTSGESSLGDYQVGATVTATDGAQMKVVAHGNTITILQNTETGAMVTASQSDVVPGSGEEATLSDLSPGEKFRDGDGVHELTAWTAEGQAIVKGEDGSLKSMAPDSLVYPPPGTEVPVSEDEANPTLLDLDLQPGDTFEGANGAALEVVTTTSDGGYIIKSVEGKALEAYGADQHLSEITPPTEAALPPSPSPETPSPPDHATIMNMPAINEQPLQELPLGTYFATETGKGVWKLVAGADHKGHVKALEIYTVTGKPGPNAGTMDLSGQWTPSKVLLPDVVVPPTADTKDYQVIELQGYKSAWGSGGKYKHEKLNEMTTGAKFKDKTGTVFELVEVDGALATFKNTTTGAWHKAPADIRVRKV